MIVQLLVWMVHWLLASLIAMIPSFTTPPAWLSSINETLSFGWTTLDGIVNMSVLLPFFLAIALIAIGYEIFHFTHQNAIAIGRGVHVDKSHL